MLWKNLFELHILERGLGYFKANLVKDFFAESTEINASVKGTEYYEVIITLENQKIESMYCSCPYAERGYNCKHMAAVLYKYEHESNDTSLIEINNLIQSADSELLKKFILNAVKKNTTLRNKLKDFLSKS